MRLHPSRHTVGLLAGLLTLAIHGHAHADDDWIAPGAAALGSGSLESTTPIPDVQITLPSNTAQLDGRLTDNSLSGAQSGMNLVTQSAFSGATGISTLIQNTGHQVLIQQTTQVNVIFGQ